MSWRWSIVAMHGGLAAVFFFLFQRYLMQASLESSWRWAIAMGVLAAVVSMKQNAK